MPSIHDSYLGLAEEITYGTAVAPARFLEMMSEGLAGKYERINSEGYRAGQRVLHKDRFAPNPKGAEGDLKLEVMDSSFGILFKHALGSIASGAPSGGFTTHTASVGDLKGRSLTVQAGRVTASGTMIPFTYEGGKVKSWELTNQVDGVLQLSLDMDFEKETIGAGAGAYAIATPTYSTDGQLFTFVGGTVTVGGSAFGISEISFKGENNLKTDRWLSTGKQEPTEEGMREISWELKGEFNDKTHADRVAASLAASNIAAISAVWTTPQGGQLTVTMTLARFDEDSGLNFDGAKLMEENLKGIAVWDGSTSPISVAYKSKDVAP